METFTSGKTTLIHGDCMDYLAQCNDNWFDLAVVDPPYGIGQSGLGNEHKGKLAKATRYKPFSGEDRQCPDFEYFKELKRVSNEQIIWGANHMADKFNAKGSCWIVWDKCNGGTNQSDCELAYTSFSTAVRLYRFMWHGMNQGSVNDGSIMEGNKKRNEKRIHPTQKPVALYKWIYINYAKPGQRVIDTHLGSGSSAIAAHYYGLEFVGIELDKDYYTAAVERFKRETRQIDMIGY